MSTQNYDDKGTYVVMGVILVLVVLVISVLGFIVGKNEVRECYQGTQNIEFCLGIDRH